ncbi:FimB/Mfa2 family fimbrial subunit [uncultured Dysgonomonas sp.]|uniref:FimB/Mfa2 family fimbrial subunit n=1 Tax=uncultured Dysgonomonas sp. TaxID=206096 RepID=UPI0028054AEB|nr:FimB/Mfa2 family fimbrial subunit [uncultured Dysgonomonas sp.]
MKLFYISLLLSALFLSGCIGEDMDACIESETNNLTLKFCYTDGDGWDIFSDKINKVDVFVFNQTGSFICAESVDKTSLSVFAGTQMNLSPGTYRIICWANSFDNTKFNLSDDNITFTDAFIHNSLWEDVDALFVNGDPLYYGQPIQDELSSSQEFTVTIPDKGEATATIPFCPAHITIEVFVTGLEDLSIGGELLPPTIELAEIFTHYNFDMQTLEATIPYRDISTFHSIDEQQIATSCFYTPLFDEDTSIEIIIKKTSDQTTVTAFSLASFMAENNITIDPIGETVIPILIEYKQASVEIKLPTWGKNPIKPEM